MMLSRNLSRRFTPRHLVGAVCVVLVVLAVFTPLTAWSQAAATDVPTTSSSGAIDKTVSFIAVNLIYPVVQLLGNLLVALINILIAVASYNDFIRAEAVTKGWVVVRDVANIVFVAVLLVIAIGTILNSQTYRYNKLLRTLVIMAFLVNFSKFIAGVAIDIAQIITLTFVSAFRNAAAGNLTAAFGLRELLSLRAVQPQDVTGYTIVGSMLLALGMVTIAVIVVGFYVVVFLIRIVALWLLIVLSPLAYALRTFPQGQKYASEWWNNFTKYVICGPILAFFLWLSLSVVAVSTSQQPLANQVLTQSSVSGEVSPSTTIVPGSSLSGDPLSATITQISRVDNLLSFLVAILLLLTSLTMAQRLCGAAGKYAGDVGRRARRAAMLMTGGAAVVGAGRAGLRAGGSAVQQTREAARNVGTYLRNAGTVLAGNIAGGARRGTNRALGRLTGGRARIPEPPPGGIRAAAERRLPSGLRFNAIAEERGKARQEDITRAQQTARRVVANRVRGMPQVDEESIAQRTLEGEFMENVRRILNDKANGKANLFKFLDDAKNMTGDRGHAARMVGSKLAIEAGHWGEYSGMRNAEPYKDGAVKFIKGYFQNSTANMRASGFAEISSLAEKNNNLNLVGIGKPAKDVGESPKEMDAEASKNKALDFLSKEPAPKKAMLAFANSLSTARVKPFDISRFQPGVPLERQTAAEDIDVPLVLSQFDKDALARVTSGHDEKKLREAFTLDAASKLLGNKANIDQTSGTVFADAATLQNINTLRDENPVALKTAWERSFTNPEQKKRVRVVDESGAVVINDLPTEELLGRAGNAPRPTPADDDDEDEDEDEGTVEALLDIDRAKYERTQQQVETSKARNEDFFKSPAYQQQADQYFDEGQYNAIAETQKYRQRRDALGNILPPAAVGGVASFATGKSNILGINANEFAGGKYQALAGGFITSPKAIREIAGEYREKLQKELDSTTIQPTDDPKKQAGVAQRRKTLEQAIARLQNPNTLNDLELVNEAGLGYSKRHTIAHEVLHRKMKELDTDGQLRGQLKSMMPEVEYQQAITATRKKMGNPDMPEPEAFTEYIVEGLANEWGSWADKSPDALKLRRALTAQVQEAAAAKNVPLPVPARASTVEVVQTKTQESIQRTAQAAGRAAQAGAGAVRTGAQYISQIPSRIRVADKQNVYQSLTKDRELAEQRENAAHAQFDPELKEWKQKIQTLEAEFSSSTAGPERESKRKVLRDMQKSYNQRVAELQRLETDRKERQERELAARQDLDMAKKTPAPTPDEQRGDNWRAPSAETATRPAVTPSAAAPSATAARPTSAAAAPTAPATPSQPATGNESTPTSGPSENDLAVVNVLRDINQTLADLRRDVIKGTDLIQRFPAILQKAAPRLDPATLDKFRTEHQVISSEIENADQTSIGRVGGEAQQKMQDMFKRLVEALERRPAASTSGTASASSSGRTTGPGRPSAPVATEIKPPEPPTQP